MNNRFGYLVPSNSNHSFKDAQLKYNLRYRREEIRAGVVAFRYRADIFFLEKKAHEKLLSSFYGLKNREESPCVVNSRHLGSVRINTRPILVRLEGRTAADSTTGLAEIPRLPCRILESGCESRRLSGFFTLSTHKGRRGISLNLPLSDCFY